MNSTLMRKLQRSGDSAWTLPARTSTTLHVGPGRRVLQVCEGRLWLTIAGTADRAAFDLWLEPGESVELPSGAAVVMEAWPSARYQLLVPPCLAAHSRLGTALHAVHEWVERAIQGWRAPALQPSGPYAG